MPDPQPTEVNDAVAILPVRESYGTDYYVYVGSKLIRVCPSAGMADEVAAGFR